MDYQDQNKSISAWQYAVLGFWAAVCLAGTIYLVNWVEREFQITNSTLLELMSVFIGLPTLAAGIVVLVKIGCLPRHLLGPYEG